MERSDTLALDSVRGGFRLELSDARSFGGDSAEMAWFTARLVGPSLSASVEVYELHFQRWAGFFRDLARDWRGWDGERVVESTEGHLRLSCSADRLGHVSICVGLAGDWGPSAWQAQATVSLDAGSLDEVALRARQFFG